MLVERNNRNFEIIWKKTAGVGEKKNRMISRR
jgi:hypothetical protein